ncbi:Manganese peroxidase 3 [Grifola frondosa]|uniref:Manganese peroxidase 3 n=1 Tax=Grifola frondosa TaxID=5627 RepID=A0A1C7LYZ0_GRIFR|nr:Manganese peroxidase 3 [Grifola frondosa]
MSFKTLASLLSVFAALQVANGALTRRVTCPDGINTVTNAACCDLFAVRDDIQENLFDGGICGEDVHESLRLTFHDAIGISPAIAATGVFRGGGADGSITNFESIETNFHANLGTDEIVNAQIPIIARHNITPGDFIQFAGVVGLSMCTRAPQPPRPCCRYCRHDSSPFRGRKQLHLSRSGLVALFMPTPSMLLTLLTRSTIPGTPFDSTPELFYTHFPSKPSCICRTAGNEGEVESPLVGEIRLFEFSRDNRTACEWQFVVNNQCKLQTKFQQAIVKLAVLGQDTTQMIDCSEVHRPLSGWLIQCYYIADYSYLSILQFLFTLTACAVWNYAVPHSPVRPCPGAHYHRPRSLS